MRWGIRDESTDDHSTTNICLKEVENCQKMSLGPNFVLLIGQKYGYRPLPSRISLQHYDMISGVLGQMDGQEEGLGLVKKWYKKDTNAVPPVMVLQPISSILPNFLNRYK